MKLQKKKKKTIARFPCSSCFDTRRQLPQPCSLRETKAAKLISTYSLPAGLYAAGLNLNDTTSGKSEPSSRDHNTSGLAVSAVSEMPSGSELSTGDYDYSEEYDNEPQIPGYVIDDSVRGEWRRPGECRLEMCLNLSDGISEGTRLSAFHWPCRCGYCMSFKELL